MSTAEVPSTEHAEAVEVIARARYERYDSHFSMPGGLSWEQYADDDPSGADVLYRDEARADLAALSAAGFLATEQEWGVNLGTADEPRIRLEGPCDTTTTAQAHGGTVVRRRVTRWSAS